MQIMKYSVEIQTTEMLLASNPADPEVYKQFIAAKIREDVAEKTEQEVETLPPEKREELGWSVFHKDTKGVLLYDYHIRGFLKSAAEAMTGRAGLSAYKSKIDKWLFVKPRVIYLLRPDGSHIVQPDGVKERTLRAMTAQGPRVSLKRSDFVNAGTKFSFELCVLPLGQKEFTEEMLRSWFEYGEWQGFGEWRNGSFGRFAVGKMVNHGNGDSHEPIAKLGEVAATKSKSRAV